LLAVGAIVNGQLGESGGFRNLRRQAKRMYEC
jgi:hypothetical protein